LVTDGLGKSRGVELDLGHQFPFVCVFPSVNSDVALPDRGRRFQGGLISSDLLTRSGLAGRLKPATARAQARRNLLQPVAASARRERA
jgi:hypothetical protein